MCSGSSPPPSFAANFTWCLCLNVIQCLRQFWLSLRRTPFVAFTSPPHLTLMMPTLLFYHQGTLLSLHLLWWLLGLSPMNNPQFRYLHMMLSLFRNFLLYLQPLFPHPPLQSLLQTARFFQVLHVIRLLSSLPGGLTANDAPHFGKIGTGT